MGITPLAKSLAGIPVEGLEYVPVFFVNPQPATVDSVTAVGMSDVNASIPLLAGRFTDISFPDPGHNCV